MIEKKIGERRKQEGIARTFLINTIRDTEKTQSKQKNGNGRFRKVFWTPSEFMLCVNMKHTF